MKGRTVLAAIAVVLVGCSDQDVTAPEPAAEVEPAFTLGHGRAGAVYVMTNDPSENEVLVYRRSGDGTLGDPEPYSTGGAGTGAGLGSQGALILSSWGNLLLAVNAGSNELSVFRRGHSGLTLTDRVSSGGEMPISVTSLGPLVYVLNAGGDGNITGFWLTWHGKLYPIPGSARPLSGSGTGPAQIEFAPTGRQLVVTEKNTNLILTYDLRWDGRLTGPTSHPSSGMTPFGFAFAKRDLLVVSEAFGGATDGSATSSYRLTRSGPELLSGSVGTTETAACWAVVTHNGRFAYVTNTGSGTVTGYRIGHDGSLALLDADGETGETGEGSSPIDAAFSRNSQFLYVLTGGNGGVSIFRVRHDGGLAPVADGVSGLPAGAVGIAAS